MYKALLIDDELHALKTLAWEIQNYCPEIEIVGQYDNPIDGLAALRQNPPDLLFLDIEMPRLSGFELLDQLPEIKFEVVFVTAYNKYAVQAFRVNAADYLLKPVESENLMEAFKRVKQRLIKSEGHSIDRRANIEQLKKSFKKIPLANARGIEFVFPDQIVYCQSDGSYTKVVLTDKLQVITKPLRHMEETLETFSFFRVHKSYLVNLQHISKYIRVDGGYLIMSNGDKVEVSRRKKDELMRLF